MTAIVLKDPAAELAYTFDWSADVVAPVTLVSVTHTAPAGLTIATAAVDTGLKRSTILVTGGVHGMDYVVEAIATLSNNEKPDASITVRCFNQ